MSTFIYNSLSLDIRLPTIPKDINSSLLYDIRPFQVISSIKYKVNEFYLKI